MVLLCPFRSLKASVQCSATLWRTCRGHCVRLWCCQPQQTHHYLSDSFCSVILSVNITQQGSDKKADRQAKNYSAFFGGLSAISWEFNLPILCLYCKCLGCCMDVSSSCVSENTGGRCIDSGMECVFDRYVLAIHPERDSAPAVPSGHRLTNPYTNIQ